MVRELQPPSTVNPTLIRKMAQVDESRKGLKQVEYNLVPEHAVVQRQQSLRRRHDDVGHILVSSDSRGAPLVRQTGAVMRVVEPP